MIKKLRIRFVCITMSVVMVSLVAMFSFVLHTTRTTLERESTQFIARLLSAPNLTMALGDGNGQSFFVFDLLDDDTVSIVNSGGYSAPAQEELSAMVDAMDEHQSGTLPQYHLRYDSIQLSDGTRYIFVDTSREESTLADLRTNLLTIGAGSLGTFFLLSILLSNWAMAPVRIAWAEQKRFISDASHELKTPITIISTNADMMARTPQDTKHLQQRLEHIQSSALRLQGLSNGLLQLARADGNQRPQEKETLNVSQLVEMEALSFEALFFEKTLSIALALQPDLFTQGQETTLRQLVAILLDNAYKYATPATTVTVKLWAPHGRQGLLSVSNLGTPIDKEHLESIFHRFYRMDDSRGQVEGYGLGLSIAKAISEDYGGKLWAESEQGVNTFFFKFPSH